jgi:hypothetical protein
MMVWEDMALTRMQKDAEEGERVKTKASSLQDGGHTSGSEYVMKASPLTCPGELPSESK